MRIQPGVSLWAKLEIDWDDLAALLHLPPGDSLPLPLPSGALAVDVTIEAEADGAAGALPTIRAQIAGTYSLPRARRSIAGLALGEDCHFAIVAKFKPDEGGEPEADVAIELTVSARLPAPSTGSLIDLRIGDEAGWTTLCLRATVAAGKAPSFTLRADILDPFSIDFWLPGLSAEKPALHVEMKSLGGDVQFRSGKLSGALEAKGGFRFSPPPPPEGLPLSAEVKALFEGVDLSGTAKLVLAVTEDAAAERAALATAWDPGSDVDALLSLHVLLGETVEATLSAALRDMGIVLRPMSLLRQLARGAGSALDRGTSSMEVGFLLAGLSVSLGRDPSFAVEMRGKVGIEIPAFVSFSRAELRLGLGHALPGKSGNAVRIPLNLPKISRGELGFCEGRPIDAQSRQAPDASPIDQDVFLRISNEGSRSAYDQALSRFFDAVEQLTAAAPGDDSVAIAYEEDGQWLVRPPKGLEREDDAPLRVLTARVGELRDGELRRTDDLAIVCRAKGSKAWQALLARPALCLDSFSLSFPLQNPQRFRVGGSVRFETDGPLQEIKRLALTVALSAEMIYFELRHDGDSPGIPIPEIVEGYGGGRIDVAQAKIGFGYSKRSLAVAFDGEIVLPERLVDDLDTADERGAGVRLPVQSRLAFQLDVTPLVVGKVVIPLPLFQFDLDLRRDDSLPLLDAESCTPAWDGLQIIVPDVVRCGLKRISYNPMLSIYASSNSNFDGDLVIGTAESGLRIIAHDVFWAYGVADCSVALLCAPLVGHPFFNDLCIEIRAAGFGFHFLAQRPIPSFSPLSIFEILALIADPLGYKVAPGGELANMVRASIDGARVVLPEPVTRLLPGLSAWSGRELGFTLNLATYIGLVQVLGRALLPLASQVVTLARGGATASDLSADLSRIHIDPAALATELLRGLPVAPRLFSADIALGVFRGQLTAFSTSAAEVRGLFGSDSAPGASLPAPIEEGLSPSESLARDLATRGDRLRSLPKRTTTTAPSSRFPAALREASRPFTLRDLQTALSSQDELKDKDHGCLLLLTKLRVAPDTTLEMLGCVTAKGAATLVTAAKARPNLRLPVLGLDPLPLKIVGRATLRGTIESGEPTFTLEAATTAGTWAPLPSIPGLRLSFAQPRAQATLSLSMSSSGAFSVTGEVQMEVAGLVFSGQATIREGLVTLTRCSVLRAPFTFLQLQNGSFSGTIGPGRRYSLAGQGRIALSNALALDVSVTLTEAGIQVSVDGALSFGPTSLDIQASGLVRERGAEVRLCLDGTASLRSAFVFPRDRRGSSSASSRAAQVAVDGAFHLSATEGGGAPDFSVEGPFVLPDMRWIVHGGSISVPPIVWGRARVTAAAKGGLRLATSGAIGADFKDPLGILPRLLARASFDLQMDIAPKGGAQADFGGDFTLAIRPPAGFGDESYFPIATQRFRWRFASGDSAVPCTELSVRGPELVAMLFGTDSLKPSTPTLELPSPPTKDKLLAPKVSLNPSLPSEPSPPTESAGNKVIQDGVQTLESAAEEASVQVAKAFSGGEKALKDAITETIKKVAEDLKSLPEPIANRITELLNSLATKLGNPAEAASALVTLVTALLETFLTTLTQGLDAIGSAAQGIVGTLYQAVGTLLISLSQRGAQQMSMLTSVGAKQLRLLQRGLDQQLSSLRLAANDALDTLAEKRLEILTSLEPEMARALERQLKLLLRNLTPDLPNMSAVLSLESGNLCLDFQHSA